MDWNTVTSHLPLFYVYLPFLLRLSVCSDQQLYQFLGSSDFVFGVLRRRRLLSRTNFRALALLLHGLGV